MYALLTKHTKLTVPHMAKKEARKILSKFDYIDTSYVTIPNRDAKLFDGEYIPHPLDLVGSCLDLKYDWRYSDGY